MNPLWINMCSAVNKSTKMARLCCEIQAATASGTDNNNSGSFCMMTPTGLHPTPLTPFRFRKWSFNYKTVSQPVVHVLAEVHGCANPSGYIQKNYVNLKTERERVGGCLCCETDKSLWPFLLHLSYMGKLENKSSLMGEGGGSTNEKHMLSACV